MTRGRIRVFSLVITDFLTFCSILLLTAWCYYLIGGKYTMQLYFPLIFLGVILIVCNGFIRLYQGNFFYPGVALSPVEEVRRCFFSVTLTYLFLFAYLSLSHRVEVYSRVVIVTSWAFNVLMAPLTRCFVRMMLKKLNLAQIRCIIAGAGYTGELVTRQINGSYHFGLTVLGYVDDDPEKQSMRLADVPVLGTTADLLEVSRKYDASYLIVCMPVNVIHQIVSKYSTNFKHILIMPDNRTFPVAWCYPCDLSGYLTLELRNQLLLKGPRFLKWLSEMVLATSAIIFLMPLFVIIAALVKLTSQGPVFYMASRLGKNGKPIKVAKFRTMYIDSEKRLNEVLKDNPVLQEEWKRNFKLHNDPRVTPLGRLLRKTSLDELPQFWNVLTGEMAVIGPRPIIEEEKIFYKENYEIFSRVKPGITGLWQVSGRSNTTYDRRVFLDMYYIMNWTIWLDYYIFLKTIKEIISGQGAK